MARSARMDNFKCFLIICVVLGHMLELQEGRLTEYLYMVIYSFHMPLFAWVSGYFAKPADRGCLKTLVMPYFVFQILYSVCAKYLWDMADEIKLLEPYWLMWFLMALFIWRLLLPLADVKSLREQGIALAVALALSFVSGWESELRYVLSFQRMLALLPMFLLGYYCHGNSARIGKRWEEAGKGARGFVRAALLAAVLLGMLLLYQHRSTVPHEWLYWRYPYGEQGGTVWFRIALTGYAFVWTALMLTLVPGRRLPLLTRMGRNTLPVYLLHGFVVKTLEWRGVYYRIQTPWLWTFGMTALVLLVCSSQPVAAAFQRCFGKKRL